MGIKRYRPTSPARRLTTGYDFAEITKTQPEKSPLEPSRRINGRNNHGRVTVRFRGGAHKRRFRVIDFRRDKAGVPAKVASIEYDPNRSARIALLHYVDGEKRYIFPYQENADVIFNSTLVYELAALRPLAEPLLFQVPADAPERVEVKRLLAFLSWIRPCSTEYIPDDSILREFIGGSILDHFRVWG